MRFGNMGLGSKKFISFKQEMETELKKRFGDLVCPRWGNQCARIVSISQAPSLSVIKNRKPFSDKSGERLRKSWYKLSDRVFYNPNNFYFTAVGMYFPGKDIKGGDKKPSLGLARKWLYRELSYLSPKLYLVLGKVAADFFFPSRNFTNLVFSDQEINGIKAFVLPHPSPVNIKWFKDHPEFESFRLPLIREYIYSVLEN